LYEFGVIASSMHMAWMRTTAGRFKSDFQYSAKITYNNFPWQDCRSDALVANKVTTNCDLYDPLAMPANLLKAHQALTSLLPSLERLKKGKK
jgi:hypothetical protein